MANSNGRPTRGQVLMQPSCSKIVPLSIRIPSIFLIAFAFLAGNLIVQSLPELPSKSILIIALFITLLAVPHPLARICGAMVAGFCWTFSVASSHSNDILPITLEKQRVTFAGTVATIPVHYGDIISFVIFPDQPPTGPIKLPRKISLKIYQDKGKGAVLDHGAIRVNDRIEVQAKLSRPRGYANPGVFDYEQWLFAQRIGARGYVYHFHLLERKSSGWGLNDLRQFFITRLKAYESSIAHTGSIIALGLGFSSAIPRPENDMLIATGVRHLFAVSGLHINLVFAFFFLIFRYLYARILLSISTYPTRSAALLMALPATVAYAVLAGFSLPTQRALVALIGVVIAWHCKRKLSAGQVLCAVAIAILLYDPLATLSISFWLSFGATALIVFYLYSESKGKVWLRLAKFQIYLSLGMACLSMLLFSRGSLTALMANLVTVPYVSFVLLPASLISVLALPWEGVISETLVQVTSGLYGIFWSIITGFYDYGIEWYWQVPGWIFALLIAGLLLIKVLPRYRYKALALTLCLPFLYNQNAHFPEPGTFKIDFLDVGQGLSVLIRTHRKVLLYDAGPSFRSGFNTGDAVVIPYLRSLAIGKLDMLIVSHRDNDHSGGIAAVLNNINVQQILSGEPLQGSLPGLDMPCHAGQSWVWDGVRFEILHPRIGSSWSGNNASCVLKVSNDCHSVLLAGDIEIAAERSLLNDTRLQSDVLLVPHHGSKTSSSERFIEAVNPQFAIAATGYKNRYGFPDPDIVKRYHLRDIYITNTDNSGMVSLYAQNSAPISIESWRKQRRRYWR